jgi:hypothetical protein
MDRKWNVWRQNPAVERDTSDRSTPCGLDDISTQNRSEQKQVICNVIHFKDYIRGSRSNPVLVPSDERNAYGIVMRSVF